MDEKPTAHLAELKRFIWDEYEVDTSEMTISRVRKRMQWSKKSVFAQKTRLLNLLILVCKCNEVRLFRFIGDINNSEFGLQRPLGINLLPRSVSLFDDSTRHTEIFP